MCVAFRPKVAALSELHDHKLGEAKTIEDINKSRVDLLSAPSAFVSAISRMVLLHFNSRKEIKYFPIVLIAREIIRYFSPLDSMNIAKVECINKISIEM